MPLSKIGGTCADGTRAAVAERGVPKRLVVVRVRSRGRKDAGTIDLSTLTAAETRERAGGGVGARHHARYLYCTVWCARYAGPNFGMLVVWMNVE